MDIFLWVIVPYVCLAVFVVGHFWRYRYDKFGWTTRSSQLYEDRMLRIGSPLFHFGMLGVVGGLLKLLVVGLELDNPVPGHEGAENADLHVVDDLGNVAGDELGTPVLLVTEWLAVVEVDGDCPLVLKRGVMATLMLGAEERYKLAGDFDHAIPLDE